MMTAATLDPARSRIMRAVRGTDTSPEMLVRQLLFMRGYRYRLYRKELPGVPDLAFPSRKKVIFIHGCFWHSHDCRRGSRIPKSNTSYWRNKRERNRQRDDRNRQLLEASGWKVLVIWECEMKNSDELVAKLCSFLDGTGA
jgi:DNA mismatch endonuclease (patch repair protein)